MNPNIVFMCDKRQYATSTSLHMLRTFQVRFFLNWWSVYMYYQTD